ncbi:MAG: hypothetical protein Q8L24_02060 [bacterium]|nr:hypothetical protein [bacterium]
MQYIFLVLAVVVCFYLINPAAAAQCVGLLLAKFGPLIGSIIVLVIIVLAFKVMLGGGSGGGGGKKK